MSNRQEFFVDGMSTPISHYCDAVRFKDMLFISGIAPTDSAGNVVGPGDAVAQTRQILDNMKAALTAAGASFGDILRVTVYLTDIDDRVPINTVRKEYFGAAYPASTLVEVSKLALPGMVVEIEAIVGLPG